MDKIEVKDGQVNVEPEEEQDENWEIYKKAFLTEKVDLSHMLINDYGINNNGFDGVQDNTNRVGDVNIGNPNDNVSDLRDRKKSKEWGKSVTEATLLKRFQGHQSDDGSNDLHNI